MNLKRLFFLVRILGSLFLVSSSSHADVPNPITTLYKLHAAQDSLAKGEKSARETQAQLLGELGAQLQIRDESFLEEQQNFYAVLSFLIHGGNPEQVQHLLNKMLQDDQNRPLVDGVLAYAQGRESDFHAALGMENLHDTAWPSALRASLYLALTPYIARKNPELADARLDYIRLIAPGSLFEEAALRRQIKIAATLKNKDKITRLVHHYASHFPNSPYLRDFWAEIMEAVILIQDILDFKEIETLLAPMPEKFRYVAYLQFARLALLDGRLEQAGTYAHIVEIMAARQGMDVTTAQFYQLAAQAVTDQTGQVMEKLNHLPLEQLPERDHALARAARNIAKNIHYRPLPEQMHNQQQMEFDDTKTDFFLQQIKQRLNEIDSILENN